MPKRRSRTPHTHTWREHPMSRLARMIYQCVTCDKTVVMPGIGDLAQPLDTPTATRDARDKERIP
jgi:DNA-directed RNA polymerase subunit RPC12/RpoP